MPVSKGTNSNKRDIDSSILFPYSLIGKKLIRTESSNESINNEYERYLDNFLRLKDPQEFVNAIKSNNALLGYFLLKNYRPKATLRESDTQVDSIRVVYETLSWWIQLHQWIGEKEEADLAKKYLSKIAPVLIMDREEVIEIPVGDGILHIIPKIKNHHPFLHYNSAQEFIQRWNQVYSVFDKSRTKKRYNFYYDDKLIRHDALKAIVLLGNKLLDDEIDLLDLRNNRTKTASYLRAVHITMCPLCRKNNRNKKHELNDATILKLLTKAKAEVSNSK